MILKRILIISQISLKNWTQAWKDQILKQKDENDLDQIHIEILAQEYHPVSGNKNNRKIRRQFLIFKESIISQKEKQMSFFVGLKRKNKRCYASKGKVGLQKIKRKCYEVIPIYVSLPSLKDLKHNLIDQALESENYTLIANKRIQRGRESKNLHIVLIHESYDEMKQDCLEWLVQEFNIHKSGLNVKVFNKVYNHYHSFHHFQMLKLLQLQGKQYLTLLNIKLCYIENAYQLQKKLSFCLIIQIKVMNIQLNIQKQVQNEFYEFLKQLKAQSVLFNEFNIIWNKKIEQSIKRYQSRIKIKNNYFNQKIQKKLNKRFSIFNFFNYLELIK
ncbi:unnamed protein product [Paramecium sonneborni]|uniref:Uncharacterized protein n=1 Tax=Paramecium sonneborni TaxID=65129 RepID=A0A8S1QZV4_9CILI|nr:unnamed protein product [Paramecium sonneborni]